MLEKSIRGGLKRKPAAAKVLTVRNGFSRRRRLGMNSLTSLNDPLMPGQIAGRESRYQCPTPIVRQEPSG